MTGVIVCDKAHPVLLSFLPQLAQNRTHLRLCAACVRLVGESCASDMLRYANHMLSGFIWYARICKRYSSGRQPVCVLYVLYQKGTAMNKKEGIDLLRGLREGKPGRKDSARLEDFVDEVEASLQAGVSRQVILETLHKIGFTFQMNGFIAALQRIRKKRKEGKQSPEAKPISPLPRTNTSPAVRAADSPVLSPPKPGPNIPGYVSKVTDKDREEYQAFKESIKDLPDRERRKKLEEWKEQRQL
jgi:hypothetical protein